MEENKDRKLNVLVYANPALFDDIMSNFRPADNPALNLVMPLPSFDLRTAASYLESMHIDVFMVEPHTDGYNITDFQSLRQKSERPILLAGLACAGPDMEMISHNGLDAYYMLPLNRSVMDKMNSELPRKLDEISKSWKKGVWSAVSTQEIRDIVSLSIDDKWQKAVITCWSPKGGVGKSTVAVELASVLATLGGRKVCILDTNMNGGHVRLRLNIQSEHSILSVASMIEGAKKNNRDWSSAQREINERMPEFLAHVPGVAANGKYNFFCIPGITSQSQATHDYLRGEKGADFMRTLIDYLKQRFDFVIIDTGSSVKVTMHMESFRNADHVLVICDADASTIADTKRTLEKDIAPYFPLEKFSLVFNRWQDNLGIQPNEVPAKVGIPVRGSIFNDILGGVTRAGNSGCSYFVSNFDKKKIPDITELCMGQFADLAASFYPAVKKLWKKHQDELHPDGSGNGKKRCLFGLFRRK